MMFDNFLPKAVLNFVHGYPLTFFSNFANRSTIRDVEFIIKQ